MLLDAFLERGTSQFPNVLLRWHLVLIDVAQATGDKETVQRAARTALDLAGRGPVFPRLKTVGVIDADARTLKRLRKLAKRNVGRETTALAAEGSDVKECWVVPDVLVAWRNQEPGTRWKIKQGSHFWPTLDQVVVMPRLEEVIGVREFPRPDVPTARIPPRWMTEPM